MREKWRQTRVTENPVKNRGGELLAETRKKSPLILRESWPYCRDTKSIHLQRRKRSLKRKKKRGKKKEKKGKSTYYNRSNDPCTIYVRFIFIQILNFIIFIFHHFIFIWKKWRKKRCQDGKRQKGERKNRKRKSRKNDEPHHHQRDKKSPPTHRKDRPQRIHLCPLTFHLQVRQSIPRDLHTG